MFIVFNINIIKSQQSFYFRSECFFAFIRFALAQALLQMVLEFAHEQVARAQIQVAAAPVELASPELANVDRLGGVQETEPLDDSAL